MLDIMRTENIMQAVNESAKLSTNDEKIKANLERALEISKQLDRTSLGVAYHLANCEQYLQGNASGFSTDFAEFCEQSLGLKRAQAFNVKLVGGFVETYTASDGTECYIDSFTMGLACREYSKLHSIPENEVNTKAEFIEYLETLRSLGQTQILTISRAMGKRAIKTKDIIDLLQIGTISADTTIKTLDSILNGKFKAIPAKPKDETKPPKTPDEKPKTPDKKPKTPDNVPDSVPTVTVTCTLLNRISAVLSTYTDKDVNAAGLYKELLDIPEFSEYLNNLQNGKKGGKKK